MSRAKLPFKTVAYIYIYNDQLIGCKIWIFVLSDIQVEAELENAKNSMLWEIDQGRLAFWHKAEKCFRDHGCKPDTVGSFFEVTSMITVYFRLSKLL